MNTDNDLANSACNFIARKRVQREKDSKSLLENEQFKNNIYF